MDFEDHDKVVNLTTSRQLPGQSESYPKYCIYKTTRQKQSLNSHFNFHQLLDQLHRLASFHGIIQRRSKSLQFGGFDVRISHTFQQEHSPGCLWTTHPVSKNSKVWEHSIAEQAWVWSLGAVGGKRKHHFRRVKERYNVTEARFWLYQIVLMHSLRAGGTSTSCSKPTMLSNLRGQWSHIR